MFQNVLDANSNANADSEMKANKYLYTLHIE